MRKKQILYGRSITNQKKWQNSQRKHRENKQTVVIYRGGNAIEESCKNREIIGKKSLKTADESGMDKENFVHVLESYIPKVKIPVIVKIHETGANLLRKELIAYDRLKGFENSVQKICDFSCMDDKLRWQYMIDKPVGFCNNKTDSLHFIVLEYIEDGDVYEFLDKLPTKKVIRSFITQCILAIMVMAYKYKFRHYDLNSGNVLVGKTDKIKMHYTIFGKVYNVQTYGITPKFVDYGRSSVYKSEPNIEDVNEDIFNCILSITSNIKDLALKNKLQEFVFNEANGDIGLDDLLLKIREIFQ